MRARRACSTCLDRALAVPLLLALTACREPLPAPTSTHAPPDAVAPSAPSDPSTTKAPPDSAGPSAPIPVLSASTSELLVTSCSPCKFSAGPGVDYEIRFAPPAKDQDLQQIELTRVGPGMPRSPRSEALDVENGWSPSNKFLLRALDLDFDGTLDLGFGPVLGTPNLTLNYWGRNSTGAGWISLGKFSNLTSDPAARELVTREKAGTPACSGRRKLIVGEAKSSRSRARCNRWKCQGRLSTESSRAPSLKVSRRARRAKSSRRPWAKSRTRLLAMRAVIQGSSLPELFGSPPFVSFRSTSASLQSRHRRN
jgi:hypothetical protein